MKISFERNSSEIEEDKFQGLTFSFRSLFDDDYELDYVGWRLSVILFNFGFDIKIIFKKIITIKYCKCKFPLGLEEPLKYISTFI